MDDRVADRLFLSLSDNLTSLKIVAAASALRSLHWAALRKRCAHCCTFMGLNKPGEELNMLQCGGDKIKSSKSWSRSLSEACAVQHRWSSMV